MHGYAIGDLHLRKSNLLAMFDNADALILKSVERVFRLALKNGVRFVVLLGDVCDTHMLTEEARGALISLFHRYDGRLDIRVILGNHDVSETAVHSLHTLSLLCTLGFFKTVKVFTEYGSEVYEGVTLEYLPWPAEDPMHKRSVVFAHYEVAGSTRDNGHRVKSGHDRTFDTENQFVQGHLHTPHSVRNHWYPGTMMQKSFGERVPKGYGEFRARVRGGKLEFSRRHVPWQPPWTLHNVVFETRADVRAYVKALPTMGPEPRVKLFVAEGVTLAEDFLLAHPEIVNRLDFENAADLQRLQEEELDLETQSVAVSHTDVLPAQLRKLGATKAQIARGLDIVAAAR